MKLCRWLKVCALSDFQAFRKCLKKIVLDDPECKSNKGLNFFDVAIGALNLAKTEGETTVPIKRRDCHWTCSCRDYYKKDSKKTLYMFAPIIKSS